MYSFLAQLSGLPVADPGECRRHPLPPTGPSSFVFTYISTEKCPHQRLVPPPPQRQILDPQLATAVLMQSGSEQKLQDDCQMGIWTIRLWTVGLL